MFSRKGRPEERKQMLFAFDKVDIYHKALSIQTDEDDDYVFHKQLTQVLSVIGSLLIDLRAIADVPKDYVKYLELMLKLFQYPSLLLRSYTIPFWSNTMHHKDVLKMVPPDAILRKLFTLIVEVYTPLEMDENATDPLHVHLEDDFAEDEFLLFEPKFRTHLGLLVESISSIQPNICFELLAQGVQHFGSSHTSKFVVLLKHTFTKLTTEVFNITVVAEATQYIVKTLLDFSPGNSSKLWSQLTDCLHSCTIYFHQVPQALNLAITKLFEGLSILDGMNPDVISDKRQIHQIIVKFGQEHAENLLVSNITYFIGSVIT